MARIFISYKRADKEKVFAIKDKIETATGEKCWIDLDCIESDAQFANVIIKAIDEAEIFLFMYSIRHAKIKDYEKDWTVREINYAQAEGKRIVFVNIDKTPLTEWFKFRYSDIRQCEVSSDAPQKELIETINSILKKSYQTSGSIKYQKSPTNIIDPVDCCCPKENITNCITYEAKYKDNFYESNIPSVDDGAAIGGAVVGGLISAVYGYISNLFQKKSCDSDYTVFASLFSSTEVKRKSHLLVQMFLHLIGETEKVKSLAQESQNDAERRDYIPLQCRLKKGDKVDVLTNIYGDKLLFSEKKSVIWQGTFTKCSFDYYVPKDIDVDELSCTTRLSVNGVPIGEMRFITRIVETPRQLNPEIISHKYNKIFISYAHKDEAQVKSFHEGLNVAGVEHFFDRTYLKTGDIFPQVIQDYINSADLFVLFWSENAAESEYVQKERLQALKRAFPYVKPHQAAKLSIYPMSIKPHTELPTDMKDYYHFGEL